MTFVNMITKLIIPIAILIILDVYIYTALRHIYGQSNQWWFFRIFFLISIILFITGIGMALYAHNKLEGTILIFVNFLIGVVFAVIISKLVFASLLLCEDLIRLIYSIVKNKSLLAFPDRHSFYNYFNISIAVFFFFAVIYGTIVGKYDYKVHKHILYFDNLPSSFEGYKVIQISDIHCGSFDNPNKVMKGVELINKQNADLILFTGDFVNNQSSEAIPYIPIFSEMKAKDGMYCVVGNHDYAHYSKLPIREKIEDAERLKLYHKQIGFTVLDNGHAIIKKDNDSIFIVGVENWGLPPFPQYGDLQTAIKGIPQDAFSILLSHDPSHWDQEILDDLHFVELTLSGHTHGLQFGIDLPFFQWSPIQWKYPRWAGLYEENGKYLYVNRGFGFIGMPARVGVRPEITLLELRNSKNRK